MFTISCDPHDLPPAAMQALRDVDHDLRVPVDVVIGGQLVLTGRITAWAMSEGRIEFTGGDT